MPSKDDFKSGKVQNVENHKGVNIVRTTNLGSEHKGIASRLIYGLSYFFRAFFFSFRNRKEFDLIISTTNPPFIGLLASFVKKFFKIPYLLIIYDVYPDTPIKLGVIKQKSFIATVWRRVNKIIYNNVDKAIVIGDDMQKIIEQKIQVEDHQKLVKVHNWSDSKVIFPVDKKRNRFLEQNPQLQEKTILLYSGNMGRTHNIELILDAAVEMQDFKDLVFVFIGGGNKKQLVEEHIAEGRSQNVISLPYQPFEILGDVLSSPTLSFVCLENEFTGLSVPSKSYGIMATGTPLVGILAKDSEIAQTIINYDCGIVHDPLENKSLSVSLRTLLQDEGLIDKYASNALSAFKENFDLKVSVRKYDDVITDILSKTA